MTRDVNVVVLLNRYKADPTISNNNYVTPLQLAIEKKYDDIIELLSPSTQDLVSTNLHTFRGGKSNDVVDSILNDDTMFDDDIYPG